MLHDELKKLNKYPFHMPGHKRSKDFGIIGSEIDITEIKGYDNLHSPDGLILDVEKSLAKIYKAEKSFMLVGGSTLGILASVFAVCDEGDTVIIARNCHKSVYNACMLRKLSVVYTEPEYDVINGCYTSIMQDTLDRSLCEYPEAKAVIITSPTYEGRISNVKCSVPLIIDAAHGAHLGLSYFPAYPEGSITVSSLHKTLPALTQTAVLNVYDGRFTDKVKYWLDVFETSSPSYVLMSSVSRCCEIILKQPELFTEYYKRLSAFRETELKSLKLKYSDDISKLVISTENTQLSGAELADILREKYGIEPEMASVNYVVLMTSVGDTYEAFENLKNALLETDEYLEPRTAELVRRPPVPKGKCRIEKYSETQETAFAACEGKVSAEFIYAYPPDIPIIASGEAITPAALAYLERLAESEVNVISDSGLFPDKILTKAN